MSVPTDDVQDLFDTGGDDGDEDVSEGADDEPADSVAWDELASIDDDQSGPDSARTGPDASSRGSDEGDDTASMDWSTTADDTEKGERATPPAETTNRERQRSDDPDRTVDGSATEDLGDADTETESSSRAGETRSETGVETAAEGSGTAASERTDSEGVDLSVSSSDADAAESPSRDGNLDDAADSAPEPTDSRGGSLAPAPTDAEASTDDGRSSSAVRSSTATDRADTQPTSETSSISSRLPTGIDALDRAMGGGVPPGRLVLLVADPGVQSELIVDSVLAQRDTLFVSTDRPDWEVSKDIEPGLGEGEIDVRDHTPDSLLSGVDSLLDELGTTSNFVLDSVNELELVPRPRYRIFLSDVKRRLFDTGSIGLLTGVTVDHESARDLTLRRADIVWRLETRTVDDRIENRLSVPKFRGGAAVTETVPIELTDEVKVDANWNEG